MQVMPSVSGTTMGSPPSWGISLHMATRWEMYIIRRRILLISIFFLFVFLKTTTASNSVLLIFISLFNIRSLFWHWFALALYRMQNSRKGDAKMVRHSHAASRISVSYVRKNKSWLGTTWSSFSKPDGENGVAQVTRTCLPLLHEPTNWHLSQSHNRWSRA